VSWSANGFRALRSTTSSSARIAFFGQQQQQQQAPSTPLLHLESFALRATLGEKGGEGISKAEGGDGDFSFKKWSKFVLPSIAVASSALAFSQPALAAASGGSAFELIKAQATDSGFLQAFLLIFVSEIGDKTFFIAGLLAAKFGRFISFTGSIGALAVMTVISTVLGQIFHAVPSSISQGLPFDDIVAVAAFTYFGLKTLYDSSQLEAGDNSGIEEEKADAEEIVEELSAKEKRDSVLAKIVQTFSLVFAAEIGDRSFLSTIALSAAQNPYAVAAGAIAAHASATGVAVAGGVLLSKYLSEKVIGQIGGTLFLVFAITTALGIF